MRSWKPSGCKPNSRFTASTMTLSKSFWRLWHRRGCGHQLYNVRRREVVCREFISNGFGVSIALTCDTRAACPKCGRIHRFTERHIIPAHSDIPDDYE